MWYVLLLLTFACALLLMTFARDSYINSELRAYQRTINEPWIDRIVALRYAGFSHPQPPAAVTPAPAAAADIGTSPSSSSSNALTLQ